MISLSVPSGRRLKSGKWNIELMINGRKISITKDTAQEAQIEAFTLKLSEKYKRNIESRIVSEPINLYDSITEYIDSRSNILSPSTIKGYKSYQKFRFRSVMDKPVNDATNWQAVINAEAKLCSPKTLKNAWGLVRAVLAENGITPPPVRLPQAGRKKDLAFLQPEHIPKFLEAIKGHRFELVYLLGLHGLRRSELLALTKDSVENGVIKVRGAVVYGVDGSLVKKSSNKTVSSARDVPVMIPRLGELVAKAKAGNLCDVSTHMIYSDLKKICKANGLPEVGIHGLRHSFASLCYHLGISEQQTMEFGGWSDINVMRKIYTHLAESDRKVAADKLKNFFK